MLKQLIILLALIAGLATASPAHADTAVSKYRVYTGAYVYTANIDSAAAIIGTPRDSAYLPTVTGGCHLSYHVNTRNHAKIIDALYCDSPGTVAFRTPATYTCGVTFNLTVDGTVVYSDAVTGQCPPPPPPGVTVVNDGTAITFTNPATVEQGKTYTTTVPSLDTLFTSADPFNVTYRTNFAGIGLNRYVYFSATISVTLAPGQTIVVTRA